MTVVDVGAHVGVYSLLAARLVGQRGVVHAIEPQKECVSLIERNSAMNQLSQLRAYPLALAEDDGPVDLLVDRRSLGAFTASATEADGTPVTGLTLDSFTREKTIDRIDLLKLDAAGNELSVLQGARSIVERGGITNVICKLYHPDVIGERFGADGRPAVTVDLLRRSGYRVELPDGEPADDVALDNHFSAGHYSVPVLARLPADPGK
jgi:FkbM family methyltransferase